MALAHYDVLAELFVFPGASFEAMLDKAIALHGDAYPRALRELVRFSQLIPAGDPVGLREIYTRTFDVQAITSLDIGYTLFGEDYKRGALLANLSGEHRRAENYCGTELADHLPNVLRLLPKMRDEALRLEFVQVLLGPALQEMIREFEPARVAAKEKIYEKHHKTRIETVEGEQRFAYKYALGALHEVLRKDFALKVSLPTEQRSTFVKSVNTEMGIEVGGPCALK